MSGLEGLKALVTGASAGIGLATAKELKRRGAKVAVLDLNFPPAEEGFIFRQADLAQDDQVRSAVQDIVAELGGLDILVNNAGIGSQGRLEENSDDEWRRVFEVNVLGLVRVTRAALGALRNSAHPAIVNT